MNKRRYLGASILALVLVIAGGASAFAKDTPTVKLTSGMILKGKPLAAGSYSISLENHTPDATVTLAQSKNVITTAQGRLVDAGKRFAQSAVVYDESSDGTRTIREIRLAGSNQAIVFD